MSKLPRLEPHDMRFNVYSVKLLRLTKQMKEPMLRESSNNRPGEPLRSWLVPTEVVEHNARAVVAFSGAHDALARIIAHAPLSLEDQVALGRLNSFCVAQWYEPVVTMLREPHIDPAIAKFFEPLLTDT